MGAKVYFSSLVTLSASVVITPGLDDMFKVYVVTVVAIVTLLLGVIFHVSKLRELIVKHIVSAVLQEIMKDPDVLKLISWRERRDRVLKQVKEEMKRRESGPDNA